MAQHMNSRVHEPARSRMQAVRIPSILLAALFAMTAGTVAADEGGEARHGTIEGHITIARQLDSQRMRFRLYPGSKPQPAPDIGRDDEWQNVVVYLESDAPLPERPAPTPNPRIVQRGETFIPHVLPVAKGATVAFPNEDPIFHNVFSLSRTRSFDLGRYPQGRSKSVTFDRAGVVPVFCHLHSNMSAVVLVLENNWFEQPDEHGDYRLEGVPPGPYTVTAWHPRSERVVQEIEVAPGAVVELDLTVPIVEETPGEVE